MNSPLKSVPELSELQKKHPHLKCLLFDMDGTFFHTEPVHIQVLEAIFDDWKIELPFAREEILPRYKGISDERLCLDASHWPGYPKDMTPALFIADKNKRLLELIPKFPTNEWTHPRIFKMIEDAHKNNIQVGLVTSSEKVVTREFLKYSGADQLLDHVITLQDVVQCKPHPEPYLKAMKHFEVLADQTVIFEDSVTGLTSARASKAHVYEVHWWES